MLIYKQIEATVIVDIHKKERQVSMMKKGRRIAALLITAAVVFIMLYSAFYIAAETDHDCEDENCPICCQIHTCQNTLDTLSFAVCAAAFVVVLIHTLGRIISICAYFIPSCTLVSLKVKLSN